MHWLANRNLEADEANLMVAFDLSREEFYQVPIPFAVRGRGFSACLELKGCLSIVCMYNIWVIKEYGIKNSWTRLFAFLEGVIRLDDNYLHVLKGAVTILLNPPLIFANHPQNNLSLGGFNKTGVGCINSRVQTPVVIHT